METTFREISEAASPRICIIGAGFSGICAGIKLQKHLGIKNYTIYEENRDVGGTWLVNTYPGCECDVYSIFYSFSFEPNPNWTHSYATQSEILQYLKDIAEKYNLYEKIKFNHHVQKLQWNGLISKWEVLVQDKTNETELNILFDVVITAIGGFRVPTIPAEFENFKGPRMHSARWDMNIDINNKTVGIVGTGASAVQIIPKIVDKVKHLVVYQRNAPWVLPRFSSKVPKWLQWGYARIPGFQKMIRSLAFLFYESSYTLYKQHSILGRIVQSIIKFNITRQNNMSIEVKSALTPNYLIGCKRITLSSQYYSAFKKPNIKLVTSEIKEVLDNSILTDDGAEQHLDVIVHFPTK